MDEHISPAKTTDKDSTRALSRRHAWRQFYHRLDGWDTHRSVHRRRGVASSLPLVLVNRRHYAQAGASLGVPAIRPDIIVRRDVIDSMARSQSLLSW
jgi:hypothetical protein